MKRFLALTLCAVMLFTACSKDEQTSAEIDNGTEITEETEGNMDESNLVKSPLTGLYIVRQESIGRRPVAVVINNAPKALPQSGIGEGEIYYEVLAEGGITRMVVIFNDFDAIKIGPVRSAREYFTYFALDNDALFVHHGGSPTGYSSIKNRGISNIDGMSCSAFWRDQERVNQPGMYEHSSYIDAAGIFESAEEYGYRLESDEAMFTFAEEEKTLSGEGGKNIELKFSGDQISYFEYNEDDRFYYRYQNGKAHIDELTGETINVKNVIVQFANTYAIAGDEAGRQEVDLVGSGTGYYFTNGSYEPISWTKTSYDSPTKWYGSDGKELELNVGKTFICVYPENYEVIIDKPAE